MMKTKMIKLFSMLACGLLAVGLSACTVIINMPGATPSSSSEEMEKPEPTEGVKYRLSDDGTYAEVYGYDGTATDVVIADTYEGKPVISIGEWTFCDCSSLTSITIPDSVSSIGDCAFLGCSSLTNIEVAENNSAYMDIEGNLYTKDGTILIQYAIGKTDTSFTIPDSVTSIGDEAFFVCVSLTSVTIGNSVSSIGKNAFAGCSSLTSVTIPDSVTSIGDWAFEGCSSLASITIPDSVISISDAAFRGCSSLTSITIPDSVTSIGDDAFEGCSSLTSITIPDSVSSIGAQAFLGCSSLTSITIPDSVTSIGDEAFQYCSSLTEIKFEGTVEQWNALGYGDGSYDWYYVSAEKVICSDGEVAI